MKNIFLFAGLILISCFLAAQEDIKFTNSNFPGKSEQVSLAKTQIKTADEYAQQFMYDNAITYYKKAQNFNPNNSELNFKLGICYYNSIQKFECLNYFENAYKLNPNVDKKIAYYLGRGLQWNYRFEEAKKYYTEYLRSTKDANETAEVKRYIAQCKNGVDIMKDTVDNVKIINLGENINSEYREYGPLVTSDGSKLYFTSRRKGSLGGQIAEDGMYYEDIYESTRTATNWTKAQSVGSSINTKMHDAIVGISPDGQTMYIYLDQNGGDIYFSTLKGSKWQKPLSLSTNINRASHESRACLSSDNKTIYFISNNTESSVGGKDIFYSTIDRFGKWSKPINIGKPINSEYDEIDVFIHPDGRTLYFTSNGHNSMGGYDIFKSVKGTDGVWSTPTNLGFPINTPLDDAFFSIISSGKKAYYTSVRPEGFGLHDIYELQFQTNEKKENIEKILVTLVKGVIKDKDAGIPLDAKIEIIDNKKNEVVSTFHSNSHSGAYIVNLPSGKNYGLNVSKEGYLFHSENFNISDTADYKEITIDVYLKRLEVGTTVILKNIFFDYNKSTLQAESYAELDRVVEILKKQPKIKIEISGHTDNSGSLDYNKKLSTERAKTVVEYLTSKGIDSERLTFKGYAFEKPITTNDTEEGKQQNRRVEFRITSKE